MTFRIIPDEGWYISRVVFNGEEITNLDPSEAEVYTKALPPRSVLEVTFTDYLENTDYINAFSTPHMFFLDKDAYYFGKVFMGLIPDEFGILISENPDPTDGEADTRRIKSVYLPELKGYFGIRLINSTGNRKLKIYLRPYIVYNGVLKAGECHYADFEKGDKPSEVSPLGRWLKDAELDNTGIIEYTY